MNKNKVLICFGIPLLFMMSCNSGKSPNNAAPNDMDSVAVMDSMRPDMPPPPPDSGRFDGHRPPPPPDGMRPGGPPPPPPHGKGRPPRKPDNMRGFDPASEDDMDDNGMSLHIQHSRVFTEEIFNRFE